MKPARQIHRTICGSCLLQSSHDPLRQKVAEQYNKWTSSPVFAAQEQICDAPI